MRFSATTLAILVTAAIAWSVMTAGNMAQTTATTGGGRVAVLDIVRVFDTFEQTQVLNRKIEEYKRSISQQADQKEQQIKADRASLDAFSQGSADWHKRSQDLKRKVFEYEVWKAMETEFVSKQHKYWLERTYETIMQEVERVAQRRGIDVVISQEELKTDIGDSKALLGQILNRKVLFASQSVDLSDEVLTNINNQFRQSGGESSINFGSPGM
jgi:Skp family chaperone for outer membrane proteins